MGLTRAPQDSVIRVHLLSIHDSGIVAARLELKTKNYLRMPGNITFASLLCFLTFSFDYPFACFWDKETLCTLTSLEFTLQSGLASNSEIFHCCLPQATKPCLNCLFESWVGLIHKYHQPNLSKILLQFFSCFISISVSGTWNLAVVAKQYGSSPLPPSLSPFPSSLPFSSLLFSFLPALFSSISPSLSYCPLFFCLFMHSFGHSSFETESHYVT